MKKQKHILQTAISILVNSAVEPIRKICLSLLGNPQDQLTFVHIAGTNGKGSVLAYVSTVLKEAGYQVGRYISPTIFSYRERIQVNETYISREGSDPADREGEKAAVRPAAGRRQTDIRPCLRCRDGHWHFLYFAEQNCDLVVLEVGMGGRLDATNVIRNTNGGCTGIHQYGSYGISWKYAGRDC